MLSRISSYSDSPKIPQFTRERSLHNRLKYTWAVMMITFTFELDYRPTFGGHDKWDGGRCNYRTCRSDSVDVWKNFTMKKSRSYQKHLSEIYDFAGRASFFLFRIGLQIPADYYVATQTNAPFEVS